MNDIVLAGCRPVPLAHYLKGLGVLRLVSEQADSSALGFWKNDQLVIRTVLDGDALVDFFLNSYQPTPIVAPWNGGSGFSPKDNQRAITDIKTSSCARFDCYRRTIARAASVLDQLGIVEKVDTKAKPNLLKACRAQLPDAAVEWIDAALVLTEKGPKYPPLLGTGGNDGRLDFTNNFMQRVTELIEPSSGQGRPGSQALLKAALCGTAAPDLFRCAVGQFLPGDAGGANSCDGFDDDSLVNPWDFVLMLEGALLFAAAAVRKMESTERGALSFPFTVRQAGVGYGSAAASDETSARAEMWMPLWEAPAPAAEIRALFAEGRARVGTRAAKNGVDFARAIASMGTDRGLVSFQRYGFQVRNGLAYFATPLNRFQAGAKPLVSLLQEIDGWLDRFRRAASSDKAPSATGATLRTLETAILELCDRADALRLEAVFVALGQCERTMAKSLGWSNKSFLTPIPTLSCAWLDSLDASSVEVRLAAALASTTAGYGKPDGSRKYVPLRCQLEPVTTSLKRHRLVASWDDHSDREVAWSESNLIGALNDIMSRRLIIAEQHGASSFPDTGRIFAELPDIAEFIDGRIDDARLADLLWAFSLIDWPEVKSRALPHTRDRNASRPTALYALLKLCFPGGWADATKIPLVPRIHRLAAMGDGAEASRAAIKRLRASGCPAGFSSLFATGDVVRRTAAALLFPVGARDLEFLSRRVLRPAEEKTGEPELVAQDQGAAQ